MHQSSERKINCLWDNRTRKLAFWPFDRLMESCTFWSGIYLHTFDAEFQMKCLRRMKCIWQRNLFETFQRGEPGGHKNSLTIYAKNNLCIKCVFNLASILLEWRTVVAPEQESDSFCASIYCGFPIMPTWYFFLSKRHTCLSFNSLCSINISENIHRIFLWRYLSIMLILCLL